MESAIVDRTSPPLQDGDVTRRRGPFALFLAAAFSACSSTVAPVAETASLPGIDYVVDGTTTFRDVDARLGQPHARYEHGNVCTYPMALDHGRLKRAEAEPPDHVLVIVFGDDGVVQRHSLVRIR
jgi:hypothetical protein